MTRLPTVARAKGSAGGTAGKALSTGHVDSDKCAKLPACIGGRFRHAVREPISNARIPEVPGAGIPHAGIFEEGRRVKPAFLPQSIGVPCQQFLKPLDALGNRPGLRRERWRN